jgi:hypothetical protein
MSASPPITDRIECVITPWYLKRIAILSAMFALMGTWFYKDGAYTWPEENSMAAAREAYSKDVLDSYDAAVKDGSLAAWTEAAKARDVKFTADGLPTPWAGIAAANGWPEKPKSRTPTEINQQFWWSGAMGILLLGTLVHWLLNRNKKLIGEADHLITPEGQRVNHADAYRIDKRNWDVKALAYVHYKPGGQGSSKKAVIDDLKYHEAGRVLDQLLANFHGEIIEKAAEVDDDSAEPEAPAT